MMNRRRFAQVSGLAVGSVVLPRIARAATPPDVTLEIAPFTLEASPKHHFRTVAYNAQIPGPLLRMRQGKEQTIEIHNLSADPEVVHWHGLFLPPDIDGAMEEGTPMIPAGGSARYTFTPRPSGFRWYHTHTFAGTDLRKSQYTGQHGFLFIEAKENRGGYDQEFFLALHDWEGEMTGSSDGAMNPEYKFSTINGKLLGAGEPLRVKQGQRVLLHILNSSPTEQHWLAFAGHSFRVIALDGNPVPNPQSVSMLRLAPAERVCALVEMNNPGVWVLGEVRKHIQAVGSGIVVEYAGSAGKPVCWPKVTASTSGQRLEPPIPSSRTVLKPPVSTSAASSARLPSSFCWRPTISIQPSQFSSPSRVHRPGSFCQKRSTLPLDCQSAAARSTAPRSS